jgi:hypothetical protein
LPLVISIGVIERTAPSATKDIPANNVITPMIIVRIAIIVTPRGLLTSCANYEPNILL